MGEPDRAWTPAGFCLLPALWPGLHTSLFSSVEGGAGVGGGAVLLSYVWCLILGEDGDDVPGALVALGQGWSLSSLFISNTVT